MSHVVPILCLIFFIGFVEIQLKNRMVYIEEELNKLKRDIKINSGKINENSKGILRNNENISKLNGKHL